MYSCVWGRTLSFATPHGAQEGRGHRLPASRDYASLAPATLLCFCQTFEADSPPPSRSPALKAPCVSLINFVLREQMVRAESVEYTPPLFITNTPSNRQLTWMNFGLPSVWNGQVWKVSFQHMTPDLNDSRFS